jgi:hypothetical protein
MLWLWHRQVVYTVRLGPELPLPVQWFVLLLAKSASHLFQTIQAILLHAIKLKQLALQCSQARKNAAMLFHTEARLHVSNSQLPNNLEKFLVDSNARAQEVSSEQKIFLPSQFLLLQNLLVILVLAILSTLPLALPVRRLSFQLSKQ